MIFISCRRQRPANQRGVLTPEKLARMQSIKTAFEQRKSEITQAFMQVPENKKLHEIFEENNGRVSPLLQSKKDIRDWTPKKRQLYVDYVKSGLRVQRKLKEFAEKNNASHLYIRRIQRFIDKGERLLNEVEQHP